MLVLSGSLLLLVPAHSATEAEHSNHEAHSGHDAASTSDAQPVRGADGEETVRIVLSGKRTGGLTMAVTLRAETLGLFHPLKFHWSLGNGQEWYGPEPPLQTYIVGRYDVILTVTDGNGKVRKASRKIDAESHGC